MDSKNIFDYILKLENYNIAAEYLGRAVEITQWKYEIIVANYIEALRLIDSREMFEKDDEVGSIFYQIKETIEKFKTQQNAN